jgi:hypothetical protein
MLDGMPIYRAITRRGIYWFGRRLGHAVFIGENPGSSKRKKPNEARPQGRVTRQGVAADVSPHEFHSP